MSGFGPTFDTHTHIVSLIQGYSIQDNWSAAKNLTVNIGVRWDHFPPWYQLDNQFAELGQPILSVNVSRPSLDDVFMSYTGTTIRDAESGATDQRRKTARMMSR